MAIRTKCAKCKHGDWSSGEETCSICVGYNKWEPYREPRPEPKPIYIGHRDE